MAKGLKIISYDLKYGRLIRFFDKNRLTYY